MPVNPNSQQSVQIIGHRGSAEPFPENTLEAILYAILSGAKMIEIDLHLTKDKEVILSHDENLSRMTGVNQNISDMTWEELSELSVGVKKVFYSSNKKNKFHLMRLKDLFKILHREILFYLELKVSKLPDSSDLNKTLGWNKKLADEVISIIKKEKMKKRCLLMSFDLDLIQYMKKEYPSYSIGIIVKTENQLNTALTGKNVKLDCLAVNYKLLKKNLTIIKNSGIPFIVWTVNSKSLWEKIAAYQPLGIVTDYPDKISGFYGSSKLENLHHRD